MREDDERVEEAAANPPPTDQDAYQVSDKPSAHARTDAKSQTPGDVPGEGDHRPGQPDLPG